MGDFKRDLAIGEEAELRVGDYLQKRGAINIVYNPDKDKKWDIQYELNGETLFMEVKKDQLFNKTGNVAIEISCSKKPSGISSTKADVWCYVLDDEFYFCETDTLRMELLSRYNRTIKGGDNNNANMILIKLKDFKEIFTGIHII